MSDLVRELRRHERDYPSLVHGPLCGQAAAEIDRLQEALKGAAIIANTSGAEIERLRGQLEKARRLASDRADFWSQQAEKNESRHDHYLVISSQFRSVAKELSKMTIKGKGTAMLAPTETREFPTAVIASLSTGRLLCKFSDMHEAAEYLMGHPIWTHHFASKPLWQAMQRSIVEQCLGMPTKDIEGVTAENVHEHIARLEAEFGPLVKIRKGSGATAMSPLDGIPDHLKDKTIIVHTGR